MPGANASAAGVADARRRAHRASNARDARPCVVGGHPPSVHTAGQSSGKSLSRSCTEEPQRGRQPSSGQSSARIAAGHPGARPWHCYTAPGESWLPACMGRLEQQAWLLYEARGRMSDPRLSTTRGRGCRVDAAGICSRIAHGRHAIRRHRAVPPLARRRDPRLRTAPISTRRHGSGRLPKQNVAGSNPVSRSTS
jgi:hypothetical protein